MMHSMHALAPQHQQLDQNQSMQQQMQPNNESLVINTMTVLESIEHSVGQQSAQLIDEHQRQQQQQQQHQHQQMTLQMDPNHSHVVQQQQQHLVQQQPPPPPPHLHQLQPSQTARSLTELTSGQHHQQHRHHQAEANVDQQQQQNNMTDQQQPSTRSSSGNLLRQRPQIEGIVADGGGPIVQWLLENYEIADGESLPRSTVYNHYLAHCRQLQMASVNAASFGKLIRSVFVGLKTRRLGTRGHSKYHYFGVRAKQHIQQELIQQQQELLQQQQESATCSRDMGNNENSNQNTDNGSDSDSTDNGTDCARLAGGKRFKRDRAIRRNNQQAIAYNQTENNQQQQQQAHRVDHCGDLEQQLQQQANQLPVNGGQFYTNSGTNGYVASDKVRHSALDISYGSGNNNKCGLEYLRNYLGANWSTLIDEHWPQPDQSLFENEKDTNLLDSLSFFETRYKSYYKRMVELLSELRFMEIEALWQEFWHPTSMHETDLSKTMQWSGSNFDQTHHQIPSSDQHEQNGQQPHLTYLAPPDDQHQRHEVTFHYLYQITSHPLVITRIKQIDYTLYAALESFLFPDVLSPIPTALSQDIDLFAKNIGIWIQTSVKDYEHQFVAAKSKPAFAFGYALGRYTSLNRLSTASRTVWAKRSLLAQMSMDLSRLDLRDIEHQVSLIGNGISENHHAELMNHHHSTNLTSLFSGNRGTQGADNDRGDPSVNQQQQQQQASDNNENHQHHLNANLADQHHRHPQHLRTMQPAQLIQNFLHLLEDPNPANSWPDWCKNLVESRVCGFSHEEAKNFVFNWNYYMSRITKKLALRSAPSLSSFQLITFLFDEYMFYLALTRLAQVQNKTAAQLVRPTSSSAPGYENL